MSKNSNKRGYRPKNLQPFYHRATILFTATCDCSDQELQEALQVFAKTPAARKLEIVDGTIEIEDHDAEPGDPADLM